MGNTEDFDPNLLKVDKKSYKNIGIYYIGYVTMKNSDYVKINSVNPLHIIINEVDESIECNSTEEKNGNKYLTFASTNKKKKVLEKYKKLWDEIKYHIKTINGGECNSIESGKNGKNFMKTKFNLDDNISLNKVLKFHNLTVIVKSVFEERW